MQGVESNASCFLFHTLYKLDYVKISQNFVTKLLKTVIFQHNLHLWQHSSPPLNKSVCSCLVKVTLPPLHPLACGIM